MTDMSAQPWHRLDRLLTRLRPHREPLSLVIDAAVVAVCWNVTYLFRLGFERWISARPGYDGWVLLGILAIYGIVFVALGVPRGIWRFSGFGEVKRLTIACTLAGAVAAVAVVAGGLRVRAFLAPAGHAAEHELGVAGVALLGAHTEALHHAGAEALDERIGARHQVQQCGHAIGVLQVQRHVAAAAQHHVVVRRLGRRATHALCALHTDDLGAHVGQQHCCERAGADAGDFEDAVTGKGS